MVLAVLLKRAALRYLPTEMVHRPKEWFLMPVTHWVQADLEAYVRDVLSAERLGRHGLFDIARIHAVVDRL